jgi:hypothetical protein
VYSEKPRVSSPIVYYGIPVVQAALITAIALTLLEGTVQLVALGIAALTLVLTPQILKRARGGDAAHS